MREVNAQYNVATPDSLPIKIATYQRRRMFQIFLRECGLPNPDKSILDIGVTSDRTYEASNYLEDWYPHKAQITAAGLDDASFLSNLYPGMKFVRANALDLGFPDKSFDVVHSSAVIEHVGSFLNQQRMISECARVAQDSFFITTPNRWFPIEFHTILPIVHWLPKPAFRSLMARIGWSFFASEENLNLMSGRDLLRAAQSVCGGSFSITIRTVNLVGLPSNLLLIGHRC